MSLKRILVPVDFSASSVSAIDYAGFLAAGAQGELILLHVDVPPAEFAPAPESAEGRPYALHSQEEPPPESLRRLRPKSVDVPCSHRIVSGDPAQKIVELADSERVDLIVMGSHGPTRLSQLLLGSVAELVVRRAHCPVLVLRVPAAESTAHA